MTPFLGFNIQTAKQEELGVGKFRTLRLFKGLYNNYLRKTSEVWSQTRVYTKHKIR